MYTRSRTHHICIMTMESIQDKFKLNEHHETGQALNLM